jgi:tripartite-type tricarboxylate transporter receptor subunit TctC
MLDRRSLLRLTAGLALLPSTARAQGAAFPTKPVKVVIPYPPGGPTDLLGRLAADRLAEAWKQPVVAENRAGASGTLGSEFVLRQPADGYTLVLGNNASHGAYELLNPSTAPYLVARDFAPVAMIGVAPQVMIVAAHVPAKDVKAFIAHAKANPGKLNYGSSAIGSSPHLAAELLKVSAGIDMQHIPFNGAAPVMQAIIAGTVDAYIGAPSTVQPAVEAGKAGVIGALSSTRISMLPDLPTFQEQGVDLVYESWFGLLAASAVPGALLDKINADLGRMLDTEKSRGELRRLGFDSRIGSRAEFAAILKADYEKTKKVIEVAKIQVK